MTDHDDVLGELQTALNVEPSPAFAEGVRTRVMTSRAWARGVWWGFAAAASVALAAVLWWRPSVTTLEVAPVTVVQSEAPQRAPVAAPQPSVVLPPPVAVMARAPRATTASAAMPASEPRLEVITNQGAILRELWAGIGAQVMEEVVSERVEPEAMTLMPPLPAITVDRIVVTPIVVPPIVVGELGSTGDRGSTAPVIRRERATGETK
jgi:hypothetical protein